MRIGAAIPPRRRRRRRRDSHSSRHRRCGTYHSGTHDQTAPGTIVRLDVVIVAAGTMATTRPVCVLVYAVIEQTAEGGEEVDEDHFSGLAARAGHFLKYVADEINKCVVDGLVRDGFDCDADDHGEFGGIEGDGDGCWGEIVIGALAAGAGAGCGVGRVVDGVGVSEEVDDQLELVG